jgi:hypothetical protein
VAEQTLATDIAVSVADDVAITVARVPCPERAAG